MKALPVIRCGKQNSSEVTGLWFRNLEHCWVMKPIPFSVWHWALFTSLAAGSIPKRAEAGQVPWEKGICWGLSPRCCSELWIPSWGIQGMQSRGISALISQGQQRGSQGQGWELEGSREGAGGIQGWSRRDPEMEQEGCRHGAGGMQAWKEESREQQGGWGEQTLLPLLWQKSKLLSAWAVPKPLQLPHLLLWAFCIKRMNYPVWYQWNSCLPWGILVPELPQSPAKGPLESLGGRNQKPGHPWAAERLQGFGVTSVDIWVFVTKHRSVSWGRKRRFLCPGANKSCLVFLGAGPGCVSVSHLYRIEINNPVYAIIMNRKHKSVNLSGNINISD